MSERTPGSHGDGWWQASDGLWYPPETHPGYSGPPTGPVEVDRTPPEGIPVARPGGGTRTAPARPPGPPMPVPRRRRGATGCLVTALVVAGLLVLSLLAVRYAVDRVRQEVPEVVGRAVDDARGGVDDAIGDVVGGPCDFLTEAQAEAVLGESRVVGLGTVAAAARPALDDRILPDSPTCWVGAASGRVARVARQDTADAAAVFDAEAAKARRGPRPYHAGGVRGFRGEAFCTTLNTAGSAGILARRGDRLVYASVTPDLSKSPGGLDRVADRVAADSCRTARALADSALG